ncbi:hypothetical protein [Streptomyces sp. NPDC052496]
MANAVDDAPAGPLLGVPAGAGPVGRAAPGRDIMSRITTEGLDG